MEAALRTAYEVITGREIPGDNLHVTPIIGLEDVKEASILSRVAAAARCRPRRRGAEAGGHQRNKERKTLMKQVKEGNSPTISSR